MRAARLGTAAGSFALVLSALAAAAGAQSKPSQRAPGIRIYSENGAYVVQTTSYVMPAIEVSENAYVFAVSMDLNGQIQVLHPDAPGISVRMLAHRQLNLPNFFTGYSGAGAGDGTYSSAGYSGYDANGNFDSRGAIIALASRAPFNLDLIASGGDWNIGRLRQLIEGRNPLAAAQALASYLGAKGEPIGHDVMRFAGGGQNQYYTVDTYSACGLYDGSGYSSNRMVNQQRLARGSRSKGIRTLGYDACGTPIARYGPTSIVHRTPVPAGKRPRSPGDTTVFSKYRFPEGGMPGGRTPSSATAAAEGVFPQPLRSGLSQRGDPRVIIAPTGRRSEPRTIFSQNQPLPAAQSGSQRQIPFDRPAASPQAATGVMPTREYRPAPRVIITKPEPAHAPPPNRR